MSLRGRSRRSSHLVAAAVVEALVPLVRNILLARLLTPQEVGLGIALVTFVTLIEILTDFGLPVYAVAGAYPAPRRVVIPTLHALALIRAVVAAALFIATAAIAQWPAPGVVALLAAMLLIRGFENLHVKAAIRSREFGSEARVIVIAQVALLGGTAVAAALTADHRAVAAGLIVHALAVVALSHAIASRPWQLAWDRAVARSVTSFGAPLLMNGAAAAAGTCDKLILASALGPAALALYNIAIGLALLPRAIFQRVVTMTISPRFERAARSSRQLTFLTRQWVAAMGVLAVVYGLATLGLGPPVLGALFGEAYRPDPWLAQALAIAVTVKLLAVVPVPLAYGMQATRELVAQSAAGAAALLIAAPVAVVTRDIGWFLLVIAVVELVALMAITARLGAASGTGHGRIAAATLAPVMIVASAAWLPTSLAVALVIVVAGLTGAVAQTLIFHKPPVYVANKE